MNIYPGSCHRVPSKMIGDAEEVSQTAPNCSPQKMSILSEISNSQNQEVDNSIVNKDVNANLAATQDGDDSEEDEPIMRRKSHKKSSRHILDDSDSEQEDSGIPPTRPTDSEESNDVPAGSDSENKENAPLSEKKKKKIVSRLDSDSDDSDDELVSSALKRLASSDDEDSGRGEDSDASDKERSDNECSNDDDDDDEPEISEELKKKLAKGAAKKGAKKSSGGSAERTSHSRKAKADAIVEIHAETQRLIRESEVRLPYHNPNPLGLNSILARAQQKRERLGNLKGSWKTPPASTVSTNGPSSLMRRAMAKLSPNTGASPATTTGNTKQTPDTVKPTAESKPTGDDGPRLNLEQTLHNEKENTEQPSTSAMDDSDDELPELRLDTQTLSMSQIENSTSETKPESDSKVQDTELELLESVDKKTDKRPEEKTPEVIPEGKVEIQNNDTEVQPRPLDAKTPSTKARTRTMLTPKLANLNVMPRLSGGADSFIDLDLDEPKAITPKPGVLDLMDRLAKHSAGRKKKAARDVEMRMVEKVKTDGDREELQLKTMTVHLSAEEESSPSLEQPGAKLRLLKGKLAEKMKVKREEARQARYKMYELDNEEGFAEDEEEEAELTEGEDTDQEEEHEEEEVNQEEEEEEMDEGEYTVQEKVNKMANPFVDDEADDDDAEDALHLALDDEDDTQTQPPPAPAAVPAKSFLQSALKKTETLQLFDDDAISESPTLSQSNKDNIELSDRPFEQLSGETIKAVNDTQDIDDVDMLPDLDEEPLNKTVEKTSLSLLKETSISSADNSFDQMSLIPAGQGTGTKKNRLMERQGTPDLCTPSSKSSMGTIKSLSKMSDLAMPIEDTQDLLNSPLCSQSTPRNFGSLDDSNTHMSHMLDEDGLLKTKSSSSTKSSRRQLMLETNSDIEDTELLGLCSGRFTTQRSKNDDEILGLCSGQFTSQAGDHSSSSSSKPNFGAVGGLSQLMSKTQQGSQDDLLGICSGQFTGSDCPEGSLGFKTSKLGDSSSTQAGMDELIGLCSGQFTEKKETSPVKKKKTKQRKRIMIHESDDEAVDDDDDFEVATPGKPGPNDEQDELDSDEELGLNLDADDSDEEQQMARAVAKGPMKIGNFLENEAELSGSDAESDENYDGEDRDDEMEACSGDEDELPSDDELRDQVGRVHMKTMIDADKKELRLMQEMYLPDGDLYSEGGGRVRRFRWKNVDDDTQGDMFQDSDEEKEEDNLEAQKWRMERHEREKFLSEQEAEKEETETPGSQVIKLGAVVFKPKKAQLSKQPTLPVVEQSKPSDKPSQEAPRDPKNIFKVPKLSCGSFLSRGKDTLAKIAEMTKPISTNINGPRNSRSFLFSSMSKDEEDEEQTKKPAAVRRSMSHPPASQPAAKKPRLEKSETVPGGKKSIFDHL